MVSEQRVTAVKVNKLRMMQLTCMAAFRRARLTIVDMEAQQSISCVLLHDRDSIQRCVPFTLLRYMALSAALYADLSRREQYNYKHLDFHVKWPIFFSDLKKNVDFLDGF